MDEDSPVLIEEMRKDSTSQELQNRKKCRRGLRVGNVLGSTGEESEAEEGKKCKGRRVTWHATLWGVRDVGMP